MATSCISYSSALSGGATLSYIDEKHTALQLMQLGGVMSDKPSLEETRT